MTTTACRGDRSRHVNPDGIPLNEPETAACAEALATEDQLVVSAVTVAGALVVAGRRGLGSEMAGLIDGLALKVVSVSLTVAKRAAENYARWGRGVNSAGRQGQGTAVLRHRMAGGESELAQVAAEPRPSRDRVVYRPSSQPEQCHGGQPR